MDQVNYCQKCGSYNYGDWVNCSNCDHTQPSPTPEIILQAMQAMPPTVPIHDPNTANTVLRVVPHLEAEEGVCLAITSSGRFLIRTPKDPEIRKLKNKIAELSEEIKIKVEEFEKKIEEQCKEYQKIEEIKRNLDRSLASEKSHSKRLHEEMKSKRSLEEDIAKFREALGTLRFNEILKGAGNDEDS